MSINLKNYNPALMEGADITTTGNIQATNITATGTITATNGYVGQTQVAIAITNGTNAVSVFGSSGLPYAITITDVVSVAQDTTAGNITVENPASTVVCTIAKGTTSGGCVGATTLSNTSVTAGTNVICKSSSAGNSRLIITYVAA